MGEKCLQGLSWKPGKRSLEGTWNRFEENIELHFKEIGGGICGWQASGSG
jgi:hypothetical protein